jgi:hypothetical protein
VGILTDPTRAGPYHPAIGLRVTVGGQHHLSGLHGSIRNIIDDIMPGLFQVEIDAIQKVVKIKGDNLTPCR